MAIGNKLKQLLEERHITVKEFAQKINVPPTTLYSFIKRDSQNAKMDLLMKICEGLEINLAELLTVQDEINGEKKEVLDLISLDSNYQVGDLLSELSKNPSAQFLVSSSNKMQSYEPPKNYSLAAHFENEEFTEDEIEEIKQFAEFVKSKRKDTD